jgi:hypothetical protein
MPEITQAGGARMVGEVEAGGVLDGQDRLAPRIREPLPGAVAVRGADGVRVDAGVVPEAIGGLGGGPIAGGLRHAGLGRVEQVVDQFDQASVQASVSEVDVAEFECGPHGIPTNTVATEVELVGNA